MDCPPGQYCDAFEDASQINPVVAPRDCTAGYYCPPQSKNKYSNACPIGQFKAGPGGSDDSSCSDCGAGKFCVNKGLVNESGDCYAGYICISGASRPDPKEKFDEEPSAYICPRGGHCPLEGCSEGADCKKECPAGTFNDKYGSIADDTCQTCENNCPNNGMTQDGVCPAGSECIGRVAHDKIRQYYLI